MTKSRFDAYSDEELAKILQNQRENSEAFLFAKLTIEKRRDRRQFWRKDIIAWIALILSTCSLILNGYRIIDKGQYNNAIQPTPKPLRGSGSADG